MAQNSVLQLRLEAKRFANLTGVRFVTRYAPNDLLPGLDRFRNSNSENMSPARNKPKSVRRDTFCEFIALRMGAMP